MACNPGKPVQAKLVLSPQRIICSTLQVSSPSMLGPPAWVFVWKAVEGRVWMPVLTRLRSQLRADDDERSTNEGD